MRLPGATSFIRNNQFGGGGRGAARRSGGDGHFGWPIYIDTDRF